MAFDYKKEYKEFYLPPRKPGIVTVPPMNFVSVQGRGDPNEPGGEYQAAMELLYGIAFTIKMSYKGSHKIDGSFEYYAGMKGLCVACLLNVRCVVKVILYTHVRSFLV